MKVLNILVGSSNPVKIDSVTQAIKSTNLKAVVKGFSVASGIAEQPRTDEETKRGAVNRARAVLKKGVASLSSESEVIGVGLEGGVFEDSKGVMWSTVWAVVIDQSGKIWSANGARFIVPKVVAEKIRVGEEMGPVVAKLAKEENLKQKQGMIGVITNNFINRTQEYVGIVKLALGLWYGRDWEKKL